MITPEMLAASGTEHGHQQALFAWCALQQNTALKWIHAIPNANSHRQVSEGVRSGVADIFLPYPGLIKVYSVITGNYHGLYIELKTEKRRKEKNGGLSEDQIEFGKYAKEMRYAWFVCYGWEEARDKILEYLNG